MTSGVNSFYKIPDAAVPGPVVEEGIVAGINMSMGDITGDFTLTDLDSWIRWSRINNTVTFTGVWVWSDRGTSGILSLEVRGLPYAAAVTASLGQAVSFPVWNSIDLPGSKDVGGLVLDATTAIGMYSSDISTPGLSIAMIPGNLGTTGILRVTGSYFI